VPTVDRIVVAGDAESWLAAGFDVEHGVCRIGRVELVLAGADAGRRLVSWSLRDVAGTDIDGLPTELSETPPREPAPPHPNGALAIDHVVAFSPVLERTVAAAERAGLELRRVREGPTPGGAMRQAFFRLGEVILEVIESPDGTRAAADRDAPARLWGLALAVPELERPWEVLGDRLGEPRDAVQPGRRIVTVRREAGLGAPVAFITPQPAQS
jgi:hypothetical protein